MSDSELEILVGKAWSLTDAGKTALRAELERRRLRIELALAPRMEVEPLDLAVLRRYRDLPEALLAKSFLESAGLESFLLDETTIRMNWLWSNLLGGVKHCVIPDNAGDAVELMRSEIPEKFDVDGVGEFLQPRCPQCQSFDLSYQDINKAIFWILFYFLNLPISIRRRRWECNSCGQRWAPAREDIWN